MMKRRLIMFVSLLLIAFYFGKASVAQASPNASHSLVSSPCPLVDQASQLQLTQYVPLTGNVILIIEIFGAATINPENAVTNILDSYIDPQTQHYTYKLGVTVTGTPAYLCLYNMRVTAYLTGGGECPLFTDGRLNDCDAGQTAAVYCKDDGSVEVKAIFDGKGYPAFTASPAEIAKVPTHPAKNTLIKQGNGAFLYRLTSGLLQVNRAEDGTGKIYSFKFSDCAKP